jgi:hypothetical protein
LDDCDVLRVEVTNVAAHPVDVTTLYVDANERLHAPSSLPAPFRLEPGETRELPAMTVSAWCPATLCGRAIALPLGRERIYLIGVQRSEESDLSFVVDLRHLADDEVRRTRSVGDPPTVRALETFLSPTPATRAVGTANLSDATVTVVRWRSIRSRS